MDYKTQYQMYLSQASAALEDACAKFLPEESEVCRAARYSLLGGGKRIRAVLVLSVCDMLGGDPQTARAFSAAVEMLHCYSLIHDDLPCMDNDDLRRGKPSCHKAFGEATAMLADFVGADLSRLTGELEKLIITLPKGHTRVTPEQIEKNIGISKDYNNFELRSALVEKDVLKANKIIKYFEENPKTNPIQMTLSLLFGFFSNLMLAYYAPEKSEQGIANMLGLRTPWQAKDYLAAMRRYNGVKTMQIIGEIRYADAKSKGVGNPSLSDGDILRELVFKILH